MDIETIVNKKKREKIILNKYFPPLVLLALFCLILDSVVPGCFDPVSPFIVPFFVIAFLFGVFIAPTFQPEEEIIYQLKLALDYLNDIKKAKKNFASAVRELEGLIFELKTRFLFKSISEQLSQLAENMRQRIYPAIDDPVAKNLISTLLEYFLSGDINKINSVNEKIESKLSEVEQKQVLYYEMPEFYLYNFFKASKEGIVRFWGKSPYSRFFITSIVLLGGYQILIFLSPLKLDNSIIAALIGASALLSAISRNP